MWLRWWSKSDLRDPMKLRNASGLLVAVICVRALAADGPSLKQELRSKVEAFGVAMVKSDYAAVAEMTYPPLVEKVGGRDKMIASIKSGMEAMKAQGVSFQSVSVEDDPSDTVPNGSELYVVVPYTLKMNVPQGTLAAKTYVIGISGDNGKSWKFVNGAKDMGRIKELLPNLPDQLKLPEYQQPVLVAK